MKTSRLSDSIMDISSLQVFKTHQSCLQTGETAFEAEASRGLVEWLPWTAMAFEPRRITDKGVRAFLSKSRNESVHLYKELDVPIASEICRLKPVSTEVESKR
ncbi:hypothetical protein CEXT_732491 [Caerostris extrusa]|uniref:Uncharacterized protein n=1 Tax=Caerostris extrusa TaxID=172846 RepID=A0AAV4R0L6_CAEEX|nr:hypothetical protein CEXT_732491 [Caerostris extrusa]